ncbi:hypothetical protein SMD44_08344 [Streptomyces alboflavus]|uniref:Uncharacterized protein n=1 Tax=Streptomyces alboflavus TaxID=67267 RepID=A0A1Z1WR25_9ACTN|nr:hypothetical protein SMD44_08344 [Streptomyces alboflavus]
MTTAWVASGESTMSPAATVRMAARNSAGWTPLPRKPLTPARRARVM